MIEFGKHLEVYKSALHEDSDLAKCYVDLWNRVKGINSPFICSSSPENSPAGMPKLITVCPSIGADGFAVYELTSDYSSPGY